MKLVTAIIQENRLDQVRDALIANEITRITVCRVSGHGQQASEEVYRGATIAPHLTPKIRIDIACNDEFVDIILKTILEAARSGPGNAEGLVGDGKILVTPLEQCIRIRTGETGSEAI